MQKQLQLPFLTSGATGDFAQIHPPSQAIDLPEGFVYRPHFLRQAEEAALVDAIAGLQFRPVDFQGHRAKRRVVEFGFHYDFTSRRTTTTDPIPDFLVPMRNQASAFAEVSSEKLVEAIITEYPTGAAIGWHCDAPQFELIVGVSLSSSCRMRLKPLKGGKISSVVLEPGSAYFMRGNARWNYQHSISFVKELRYSITFRTLRERKQCAERR